MSISKGVVTPHLPSPHRTKPPTYQFEYNTQSDRLKSTIYHMYNCLC